MGLNITLTEVQPVDVWSGGITHNLTSMASKIKIRYNARDATLYDVMWHPEALQLTKASQATPWLIAAKASMVEHKEYLKQFNSPNGWGIYDNLLNLVTNYIIATEYSPTAKINTSL